MTMLRYTNKAITTAEMISRLIDLANSMREAERHGEELARTEEEAAFYDALAENESDKNAMQRHSSPDGPRADGDDSTHAQARLDVTGIRPRNATPQCAPVAGQVRVPA